MNATRTGWSGAFRIRDMRYGRTLTQARHGHAEVQVSIVLRGAMREEVNGVGCLAGAGDVCVKPAGVMHEDVFDDTRILCIDADPSLLAFSAGGYAWHRLDDTVAAGLRVARRFLAGADVDDELIELLAALPTRGHRDRAAATRAAELLESAWNRPFRLTDVAAQLGLHPVYLARIFREQWNVTPREYLLRLRVRAAADRIASTRVPLADIAAETGFSDQAHMTRTLSRILGMTPGSLRRLAG